MAELGWVMLLREDRADREVARVDPAGVCSGAWAGELEALLKRYGWPKLKLGEVLERIKFRNSRYGFMPLGEYYVRQRKLGKK